MFKTETTPVLNNLRKIIWEHCRGKIVIVGIGNILKGDDGFGPVLISRIKNKVKAVCIDAQGAPENYIGKITQEKPDLILLIDAVSSSNGVPGEVVIYNPQRISRLSGISTHNASLRLFLDVLSKESSAKIYLIGINPANLNFESTLSFEAERSVSNLEQLLLDILSRR